LSIEITKNDQGNTWVKCLPDTTISAFNCLQGNSGNFGLAFLQEAFRGSWHLGDAVFVKIKKYDAHFSAADLAEFGKGKSNQE